jgi:voltage-gated sodium channel
MLFCHKIATSRIFEITIISLILLNAVVMGLETSQILMQQFGQLFVFFNWFIQAIFVIEIGIRILAHAPDYRKFFKSGWNLYDFTIVLLSTLPLGGAYINVARLARVLRITRVVTYSLELRLIIGAMLRSIPSIANVILLLFLLLYVYAIIGFHYFSEIDPDNWSTLGHAFLTLFQLLTLEDWPDIREAVSSAGPLVWLYFVTFIILAVFVVMNLFIAVVINNLEAVRSEGLLLSEGESPGQTIKAQIQKIRIQLDKLEALATKE